jgi:hypothetical protein
MVSWRMAAVRRRRPRPRYRPRPPSNSGSGNRLIGPLAVGGLVLAIFVVLVVLNRGSAKGAGPGAPVGCDAAAQVAIHYHAHLDLFRNGRRIPVPAGVGTTAKCVYWLHTNQASGIVHVAAPASAGSRLFTLGDFLTVWGQPPPSAQAGILQIGSGQQLKVWQDGRPFTGGPAPLVLRPHTQVVVELGPPFVAPPGFDWHSPAAVREGASRT